MRANHRCTSTNESGELCNETSRLSGEAEKPNWTREGEEEGGHGRFRHRIQQGLEV